MWCGKTLFSFIVPILLLTAMHFSASAQLSTIRLTSDSTINSFCQFKEINTLPFELYFPPTREMQITYTPTRNPMRANKQKKTPTYKQLENNVLSLEDLRCDYAIAHPREVKYTWDMIPELWRPLDDSQRTAGENLRLAKLFETETELHQFIVIFKFCIKAGSNTKWIWKFLS